VARNLTGEPYALHKVYDFETSLVLFTVVTAAPVLVLFSHA